MSKLQTAKVFWSGRSQAVRLPKEFRVDGKEVLIRREGDAIVLQPLSAGWEWLKNMPGRVDADFEAAANDEMPWGPSDKDLEDLFK